ncbi:helix-turn-helix domain-containing protein [Streptomyces sp. SID5474]|nr:helix-turn-helix domain-containing protein [Streptomyces sp. SID5474]
MASARDRNGPTTKTPAPAEAKRERRSGSRWGRPDEKKTVRRWLHRFNEQGPDGLGDRPGCGRKRRITEAERCRIVALVKPTPPGRLEMQPSDELWAADESGPPEWTSDALAAEAGRLGIRVSRSQVRRILLAEGVRWRRTRSWVRSRDPDFAGNGHGSSSSTPARPKTRRSSASTNSAR